MRCVLKSDEGGRFPLFFRDGKRKEGGPESQVIICLALVHTKQEVYMYIS